MSCVGFSDWAISIFFSNLLFFGDGFDFAAFGSSKDSDDLWGELESSDGDDLSFDVFSIDQDSFVAENVDDGGEFSLFRSVWDSGDTTDLHESFVSLNEWLFTMFVCGEIKWI